MANKKINQLVLKTAILPTDLFPLGDATTGQLYKKTVAELQAAIGGAVISVNGLTGVVVLDTDDVQELASPTNRYFTEARARAAISLTTTGNSGASTYSSSTGVLNVPTYTLAGLGGITAGFLSGGIGITYNSTTGVISYSGTVYTDASIRALVSAGTGLSYNSTTGVFSYSGTVYTDSIVRALITGTAPITYNNTTGAIGITQATTSTNGYLSSTDWNTFNGKQSALTLGNFTEATSSVLTITGGTGSVIGSGTSIQVKQASSTVSGFLSSTDWTTFNSKQNALTNPVTGTGTSGHVAYWNGSGTLAGSANHFWDNTNGRLGIGTASPTVSLDVVGAGKFSTYIELGGTQYVRWGLDDGTTNARAWGIRNGYNASGDFVLVSSSTNNTTLNTTRVQVSRDGNVGIGTTSPSARLEVQQSTDNYGYGYSLKNIAGNTWQWVHGGDNNLYIGYNSTTKLFVHNNGNVGIGTASPSANLHILRSTVGEALRLESTGTNSGSVSPYIQFTSANQVGGTGFQAGFLGTIWTAEGNGFSMIFGTKAIDGGQAEKMRITHGGNILMGTTTDNGERLYVSGSIRATGSITANSDARLKKNIERIENALEKVGQISGYTYNTIYDEDRHAGVIAQEIDKVLPEIVNTGNDGLMGVEYGNISALLIEAIKEQKVLIESLQAKVEALSK